MIGVFAADSSRFDLTSEQLEAHLGRLVLADARPRIERRDPTHTALQWQTPDTEHGFQLVVLGDGIVLVEGDRPHVAQLVVAIRQLFDADATDIWVGSPGQGLGRLLHPDDTADEVLEGWDELPLDQFS